MIVKDVMTSPAITVDAGTTVKNALRLLDRYRVTSLPVTDAQGQVVGIVSEADLLRDLVRKDTRAHMLPPAQPSDQPRTVGQVMTTLSLAVCADTDLSDAVDLMTSTAVKSLPVLEQGRVVGVVSRSDVVRVLARADEQIEAEVDEILRSAGVECEVEVTEGVVSLTSLADPAQWRVAEVVAGSVAGVISVTVGTEPGGSAGDGHRPFQDGAVRFLR